MSKFAIIENVTRTLHRTGFQLKKHSPEILLVTGIVGVITSAVMACKATTKVSEIMDDTEEKINEVHEVLENENISEEEYSEEDSKKDLAIIYAQTGISLIKLYAPSVILGTISIVSIIASNNILHKRNVAIMAAYAAVDGSFKEYRSRVIDRFGESLDKELKYGTKVKEVEEIVVDDKGEEQPVKKTVEVVDPNAYSEYARFFDDGNTGWVKDAEQNLVFLKHQQNYANDLLRSRGHLFLNEVYDMLGIPRTKAGQVVGWIYDEKDPDRDNFVSFGIYDFYKDECRRFVNGAERTILLDFNVDGVIYDKI